MDKSRIVIILGTAHLRTTPGKCSPDGKFFEAIYSRERVEAIAAKLRAYGYRVVIDYESLEPKPEWTVARKKAGYGAEQQKELDYRVQRVNALCRQHGAENCLYVSLHVNGAGDDGKWHGAGGWSAYTSVGQTKGDVLAECLYDAAINNLKEYFNIMQEGKLKGEYGEKQTPIRMDKRDGDRDLEAHLYVLKKTLCAAVLTENMFQDNKTDVAFLTSDAGKHAIERLHVEGIIKYLESL